MITFKPFEDTTVSKASANVEQNAVLIDINEASKLLGLKSTELKMIILAERQSMSETGEFEGMLLPYIVVNGNQYFERTSLLKWAVESSNQLRVYNHGAMLR
jgi:hypothetical protein